MKLTQGLDAAGFQEGYRKLWGTVAHTLSPRGSSVTLSKGA